MKNVSDILKRFYKLEASSITALEGYGSQNYKIATRDNQYILKITDKTEESVMLARAEGKVLQTLSSAKRMDFPSEIPMVNSELATEYKNQVIRLLTYVEGDFLGEVAHSPELLYSFGSFLGRMDKALSKCTPQTLALAESPWDLQYFPLNLSYLSYIENESKKSLVSYFFMQYKEVIDPLRFRLRKAVIHNDANDWNVLVKNNKVSGIIDFGDMCYSWLINELAVAITYVMMGKENPLKVAQEVIRGYHMEYPLEARELDVLYYLVAARLSTSVCNSAYHKTKYPDSEYITISENAAWKLLENWLAINPIRAKNKFRAAAGIDNAKSPELSALLQKRRDHLSSSLSMSYELPIHMKRAAFQYMYDADGNTFLDAYNNIMLAGHSHPHVVSAGQRTMARLNTNTRYLFEEILNYGQKLLGYFPENMSKVFFVNSGSAASDLAVRMAKHFTGRENMAVLEHGYHGNTATGLSVSHYKYANAKGEGKKSHITELPLPKVFGAGFSNETEASTFFISEAKKILEKQKGGIAAFIAEPIVGCGGQVSLPKGYLKEIYPLIRAQGGICISDEVQVGFGRLGDYFWGYEMQEVVPDIVILGKPMGNGHPIGAVVTTAEIAKRFEEGPEFFSSFGGNPVSCAIGQAVLEVIEKEELPKRAKQVGDYLKDKLEAIQSKYPILADIRGSGLFLGIEIAGNDVLTGSLIAKKIKNDLRMANILTSTDGPLDNVIKIKPPLSFSMKDADKFCVTLDRIIGKMTPE